jgi:hypothetical protein
LKSLAAAAVAMQSGSGGVKEKKKKRKATNNFILCASSLTRVLQLDASELAAIAERQRLFFEGDLCCARGIVRS